MDFERFTAILKKIKVFLIEMIGKPRKYKGSMVWILLIFLVVICLPKLADLTQVLEYFGIKPKASGTEQKNQQRLQVLNSLKLEFQENKSVWQENYKIVTEDRGGLQQNKREDFLSQNKRWVPIRPLYSFLFKAWENVKINYPDLLKEFGSNDSVVLNQYYAALKEIQNYIDEREKYRTSKEENDMTLGRFELLNQNVISIMEKNEEIFKQAEHYLMSQSGSNSIKEAKYQTVISVPVSGDTVVPASGATVSSNIK